MWARVARFDGDPADVDARLEKLRSALDAGTFASELADTKLLMLVDRESGGMIGVTLALLFLIFYLAFLSRHKI